jgi:transposase-like protein
MTDKIERIKSVIKLFESNDLNEEASLDIIGKIIFQKIAPKTKIIIKGNRRNKEWTPEEKELLKRLLDERKSYGAIAKQMGRTYDAIRIRAERGETKKLPKIYYKFPRWTPDEEEKIIKMLGSGKSIVEIAGALKRTPKAVELRIYDIRKRAKNGGMFSWRGKNGKT